MKLHCLIFVFLILFMQLPTAWAQPSVADSLLNELKTSRPDTHQISILLKLAWAHRNEDDIRKAIEYAGQALQLSKKLSNKPLIAASAYELGAGYWTASDLPKARQYLNQSILLADKLGDDTQLIKSYNILGSTYSAESSFDQALRHFRKGLGLAQKLNDKEKISGSLINIGNVFLYKGEYVNATTQYLQALRLAEEINYTDGIDVITANLGAIYYYQGDLAKAETYYRRSLQIDRQENDNEGIASNLESLGVVYVDQKKYNQAFSHFEESRAISERIGNLNGVATAMSGIAKVYEKTGKWQKALEVNRKALPIAEQIQNKMLVAVLKINMADVYRHLHQYTASLQYGKQALELSRQTDQKENTKAAYESLTNTYEAMRQPQQALLYYKQFVQYKDSLLNETNVHKVNELQTQYETEKKEQQIKMLSQQAQINQLQLQQQRFYIAACVALVLLVILFGFLFISQQALKNHQRTTELEQKLLVTQMNPHFIFNALIAIQNFMFKNNPVEAGKYLAKFAKLMRLILENSRQPYITLSKEIQTLEYYFELQQLRFQQAFDFQIYVDPQLSPEQVSVPPMFVQPLVENALEHGLLHKTDKGIVKVRYLLKGDKILLEVEDNGVGLKESAQFKQSTQPGYTSLATKITQERLAILNHSKNRKVTFNVVDLVNVDQIVQGTKATFFIPFKTLT